MDSMYGYGVQNQGIPQNPMGGNFQGASRPMNMPQNQNQSQNPFMARQPRYGLNGRYIHSPEEIQAGEVPMDGNVSFFPMADNSVVIGKMWGQDGLIKEVRYVPENLIEERLKAFQANQSATITNTLNTILDKISKLESSLNS